MAQLRLAWKSNHPIYQRISVGTKIFLDERGQDILDWLWDSNRLIDQFKTVQDYSDYSFTIAPAYKALEKWLLLLAPYLGVPKETVQYAQNSGKLGIFLSDNNIDKFFDVVLAKLEIETAQKHELQTFVQGLNSTLKNFRHNPAHCGTVIENGLRAESNFFSLLHTMDNITQFLIDTSVIPHGGHTEDPMEAARLSEARKKLASL